MTDSEILQKYSTHISKAMQLGYKPIMPINEPTDVSSIREVARLMEMEYFSIGLWLKYNRLTYIDFGFDPTSENYKKLLTEIMEEIDRI
jgi:hypothetical protein